jgi:hypothetical protein
VGGGAVDRIVVGLEDAGLPRTPDAPGQLDNNVTPEECMDKIKDLLVDPTFWFVAVFLVIVMNLLSSYLKEFIDKRLAMYSKSRRDRSMQALFDLRQPIGRMSRDTVLVEDMRLWA